jgi:hypothetical protein
MIQEPVPAAAPQRAQEHSVVPRRSYIYQAGRRGGGAPCRKLTRVTSMPQRIAKRFDFCTPVAGIAGSGSSEHRINQRRCITSYKQAAVKLGVSADSR